MNIFDTESTNICPEDPDSQELVNKFIQLLSVLICYELVKLKKRRGDGGARNY